MDSAEREGKFIHFRREFIHLKLQLSLKPAPVPADLENKRTATFGRL